jgi:uncharacterized membrane protein YhaH (DUF805 family)
MQVLSQLPLFLIFAALTLIPSVRLLRGMGKSRWWALLGLVPIFSILVLVWILAYSRWPARQRVVDVFA